VNAPTHSRREVRADFLSRFARASMGALLAGSLACSHPPDRNAPKQWSLVRGDLDRVPLCVWGATADDVWIGGGGLSHGGRVLLLRGSGTSWREEPYDMQGTVWWIHGTSATDVWAVGENGLALHWDGAAWSPSTTGTAANLFGVWAAAPNDVWAVGGSPTSAGPNDVILHYDGAVWSGVAPPRILGATYFKVWGLSPIDVFVVASAGLALHFDGASWSEVGTGAHATLFTVHGGSAVVRAIGGAPPVLLRWDGQAFQNETVPPQMSGAMTGIFADASGVTFITGERYQRYQLDAAGSFRNDTDSPPLFGDLHSVWGDGQGNAVAVGGNYVALTSPEVEPRGLLVRYGN
jgi:hypothetical protein